MSILFPELFAWFPFKRFYRISYARSSGLPTFECRRRLERILCLSEAKNAGVAVATASIFNEAQGQKTPKMSGN